MDEHADNDKNWFALYPEKVKKMVTDEIAKAILAMAKILEGQRKLTIKEITLEHNKGKVSKVQVNIDNI